MSDNTTSSFEPRYAIVTGSDSGIGRETAVALAEDGLDIGITWHSDEDGANETARLVRESGRRAVVAQLDTSELEACGDVIDALASDLGGLGSRWSRRVSSVEKTARFRRTAKQKKKSGE